MKELLEETQRNSAYIKKQGFNLVECWECEWREMKKRNTALQQFIATQLRRPLDKVKTMTTRSIVNAVKNDTLFGFVECDIHVPESLREYFKEMCPIFKNTEIRREDIGEFMKSYARRKQHHETTSAESHWKYDRKEDNVGNSSSKVVFRTWFRGTF